MRNPLNEFNRKCRDFDKSHEKESWFPALRFLVRCLEHTSFIFLVIVWLLVVSKLISFVLSFVK